MLEYLRGNNNPPQQYTSRVRRHAGDSGSRLRLPIGFDWIIQNSTTFEPKSAGLPIQSSQGVVVLGC